MKPEWWQRCVLSLHTAPMLRGDRRLLIAAVGTYLLIVAAIFLAQRWLIYPAPSQVAPLPAGFERIALQTADHITLVAAYRRGGPNKPTLVFFHGNGDSWTGAATATSRLAQEGYGVLLAAYRGYSGNPGSPSEHGLYADGRAALAWLEAQGIDKRRLILIGNSLGSGVATQLASEGRPAGLVLISPYTSMGDVAARQYPWLPARALLLDRFDNLAKIGRVDAPVLILHGKDDKLIPSGQAAQLARASSLAELRIIAGAGHDLAYRPEAQDTQSAWFKAALANALP